MAEQKKIRLALIGLGRIGKVHFNNILQIPNVVLSAVVDVDEKITQQLAKQCGCKGYSSHKAALADKSNPFDGVIICTPTDAHYEVIKDSLEAGKPVLCEKPISLKLEEVDAAFELAAKKGIPLCTAYQRRLDPSFAKLKATVDKGGIGQVQYIISTSRDNPVPSKDYLAISGKVYHDCGSHDIDLLRWVVGEEPIEVCSYASTFRPEIKDLQDWDNVAMMFKWKNGVLGAIHLNRKAAYGYDQRLEVLGDKGMVQVENPKDTSMILANDSGFTSAPSAWSFPTRYPVAYQAEIYHFIDLITGKVKEPYVSHKDVRNIAIIAHTAQRSAELGKPLTIDYSIKSHQH